MAIVNVVVGIGMVGQRVIEQLRRNSAHPDVQKPVLLSVKVVEEGGEAVSERWNASVVRPKASPMRLRADIRAEERAALMADYQRGGGSQLYQQLWLQAERALKDVDEVALSVVAEAGGDGSGIILDITHAVRILGGSNQRRVRFVRGYIIMPTEGENRDKEVRAYATFSELHRYHASKPLLPSVFHYADSSATDLPDAKYWRASQTVRPFDLWYIVENRTGVEQTITTAIETSLLGDNPQNEGIANDVNIGGQAGLRANSTVGTLQGVTFRLPVEDLGALWKVEDILAGMDVFTMTEVKSTLDRMSDAVVFNTFSNYAEWWKRTLQGDNPLAGELRRLQRAERLDYLLSLPIGKDEAWRSQDELFRAVIVVENVPSADALRTIESHVKQSYEPVPCATLQQTLDAILALPQPNRRYVQTLSAIRESVYGAVLKQFDQLTSNKKLVPEDYRYVTERATSLLSRLATGLSDLARELAPAYEEVRQQTFTRLREALENRTFTREMFERLRGVSPAREAAEGLAGWIMLARTRHIALAASSAYQMVIERLNERAEQARQLEDAIVLWREALGRQRRALIERLGALHPDAPRVEAWATMPNRSALRPKWDWSLSVLLCNNQRLSLTTPDVEPLLNIMGAHDDAAERLSVVEYLSKSLSAEQLGRWLSQRLQVIYDTLEGLAGTARSRLYHYAKDTNPELGQYVDKLATTLAESGISNLQTIYHAIPSVFTVMLEITGLIPTDNIKAVKRAQRMYNAAIHTRSIPSAMPGEKTVMNAYAALMEHDVTHRATPISFAPRALHLADNAEALLWFWKGLDIGVINYRPTTNDDTTLRWVVDVPSYGGYDVLERGWFLTVPAYQSYHELAERTLLDAVECFVINAQVIDGQGLATSEGRLADAVRYIGQKWRDKTEDLTIPDDLSDEMRSKWHLLIGRRPAEHVKSELEHLMRLHTLSERLALSLDDQARRVADEELASVYQMSALLIRAEAKQYTETIKTKTR